MDIERILHLTKNDELNNVTMIKKCIQTKPVIIFMVAPWCGHCQRLEPTINTLEKELIEEPQFNKLHIIKVHDEFLPKVNLNAKSYPTISLFNNGEHISDHDGDRESQSIKDFISNNISRNSQSVKPKRNCRKSRTKRSSVTEKSGPISNILESFNLKEKYDSDKNYEGPGSDDPNWLRKSLNIKDLILSNKTSTGSKRSKGKKKSKGKMKSKGKKKSKGKMKSKGKKKTKQRSKR